MFGTRFALAIANIRLKNAIVISTFRHLDGIVNTHKCELELMRAYEPARLLIQWWWASSLLLKTKIFRAGNRSLFLRFNEPVNVCLDFLLPTTIRSAFSD